MISTSGRSTGSGGATAERRSPVYATGRTGILSAGSGGSEGEAERVGQRVDQRDPLPRP